jgi:hypothetical protein
VVRGLADAMGADVSARPSALGGLAMDVELPKATLPVELAAEPAPRAESEPSRRAASLR